MAPKVKVTYFNGRGRAEPARMMLNAANVEFEDERIDAVQWAITDIKESKP